MYPTFPSFRRQPPDTPQHRFDTLPLSVLGFPPAADLGFASSQQARRNARPNRVRHPTDRWFTSGYSPPRLVATQLPSVTGLDSVWPEEDLHLFDIVRSRAHWERLPSAIKALNSLQQLC